MSDNLVSLTIDGRTVRVPRGTLLVDAAKSVGITIPVFCYHEKMKPYGACRMCMVEITPGPPLPQTACTTPVAEGMVVQTKSERAVSAQKATIEFLLINHPLDCPVCDRGGECPLQDNTFGFGGAESRYVEEKRHFVKPLALSNEVLLDRERCILCYRCVRFEREIAGDESLTVIERGTESQIGLAPGRTFDSPFSGNTIEICPVGALTSARYRFVARPWDIRSVATVCPHCPVGCNVRADVRNNEIKRFLSRENTPVDDGWLCDRGRFGYAFPTTTERLTQPLVRRNGQLEPASWTEAIDAVRAGLEKHRGSVGGIAGGQLTNEDLFLFKRLIGEQLGSPNLDHTTDPHPVGPTYNTGAIGALDRCDVIVLVDVNPIVDQPVLDLRLKKAANRGARLVVMGPDEIDLVKYARAWLRTPAGGEVGVIEALMRGLPKEQQAARERRAKDAEAAADRAFADAVKRAHDAAVAKAKEQNEPEPAPYANVEEGAARYGITRQAPAPQPEPKVRGVEELLKQLGAGGKVAEAAKDAAAAVADAATSAVAAATGAGRAEDAGPSEAQVASATQQVGGGTRVAVLYRRERAADAAFATAVTNLALLTEAQMFPLVRETNQQGALDVGVVPGEGGKSGAEMARGQVKALYVAGRELGPVKGVDFLVVQDYHLTETAQSADVVLPGQTFAEKDGSYTNLERRVQRLRRCIEAPGDSRPDWRIFRDVLNALGGEAYYAQAEDVLRDIPAYKETTFGKLGFKGVQMEAAAHGWDLLPMR